MASQGSQLQEYNNELVKFIEDLRTQREVVNRHIEKDRQQQQQLEKEISRLAEQLQTVNGELNSRLQLRKDIDQSIEEAEDAFNKILHSSETLLQVLKRDVNTLSKSTMKLHQ